MQKYQYHIKIMQTNTQNRPNPIGLPIILPNEHEEISFVSFTEEHIKIIGQALLKTKFSNFETEYQGNLIHCHIPADPVISK